MINCQDPFCFFQDDSPKIYPTAPQPVPASFIVDQLFLERGDDGVMRLKGEQENDSFINLKFYSLWQMYSDDACQYCGHTQISAGSWTVKPQILQLTKSAVTPLQKDEQKVIFTVSFLIWFEGTDLKASAAVPVADLDNPKSSCSVQQQGKVGETKQYHILYMLHFLHFFFFFAWLVRQMAKLYY